ncbi:hypothetical protein GFER_05270 [Geoalkalibacter ferrihydriticus DSM 17813]|uniref:Uncharacterized protein n=1 Tax=Geoalkalibacter ferrihydriticus DSM 17813 TaxID=1121915 RepID=A0A0C2HT71_9BACT|nr:hypothetical protein GFER_05270 [Geoalkalibacter ferrihydriticus DSM 17813]
MNIVNGRIFGGTCECAYKITAGNRSIFDSKFANFCIVDITKETDVIFITIYEEIMDSKSISIKRTNKSNIIISTDRQPAFARIVW